MGVRDEEETLDNRDVANGLGIGHILQEAEGNGISEEQDAGKAEGRRCSRNAGADWTSYAWEGALNEVVGVYIMYSAYGRRLGIGHLRKSPRIHVSIGQAALEILSRRTQ